LEFCSLSLEVRLRLVGRPDIHHHKLNTFLQSYLAAPFLCNHDGHEENLEEEPRAKVLLGQRTPQYCSAFVCEPRTDRLGQQNTNR